MPKSGRLRLLIADRSINYVDLLAHALRSAAPMEVLRATDSESAWRLLAKGHANAALIDLTLAPRSATELVVALRRLGGRHAQVPVIGMSSLLRREDFDAATRAGINLVVTKPVSVEMIISRLTSLRNQQRGDLSDLVSL